MKRWLATLSILGLLALAPTAAISAPRKPVTVSPEALSKAPTIGKVIGYNRFWGFAVTDVGTKKGVKSGMSLAVRRDGQIVIIGIIEDATVDRSTLGFVDLRPNGELTNRPRLGDEVFIYPPRGS